MKNGRAQPKTRQKIGQQHRCVPNFIVGRPVNIPCFVKTEILLWNLLHFFSGSALWSPVSCITNNSYSRRSSSRGPRFSSPKCRREATVSSTESSKSVYLPALSKCGAKISFEKEDEKVNGINTTFLSLTSEKTNFSGRASSRYYPLLNQLENILCVS